MWHNFFKAVFNFTNVINNRVRNVGLLSNSICKSIINFFLMKLWMYYQLQATKTKGHKCSDTSLKINGPFLNSAQWTLFEIDERKFNLCLCDIFQSPVWNLQVIYKFLQNGGIPKLYFIIGLIRELIRWNIQKM